MTAGGRDGRDTDGGDVKEGSRKAIIARIAIAIAIVGAEVKRSRAGTCGAARRELGDGRWEMR
jgi:hypothetical protein